MNEQQWNGAFSAIRAEASLKEETLAYLARRTHGYRRAPVRRQLGAALAACLVVVSLVGGGLFFTPAYALSLELPAESASGTDTAAWELEVNCFHRIVSCTSTSEDSAVLSDTASLRFQDWRELLQTLLTEDTAEPVSVTVISGDPDQSADVLEDLQTWTAQRPGLHCGSLTSQEAQEAQSVGLSCWKYQIYLKVKSLYPDLTSEAVKEMTMQELQELLGQDSEEILPGNGGANCGQASYGNHHRHGWES